MPRRPLHLMLSSLLFAGAACGPVHGVAAAELGDIRVGSHIGQPLVADIELALVDDAGHPVEARLADPEVYRGAGIAMPSVLATLHLSVMRRDGRQFVHVTSLRPVDGDHLHLYLDLADGGQRSVRLATLWLTPDPNPAPPPVPMPAAPAPAPAFALAKPAVAEDEPPPPHPAPVARRAPAVVAAPLPVPVARPRPHAAEAPACARPSEEAQACVALGAKNAALRTQLGSLEEKVRGLQASLAAPPAPPQQQPPPEPAHEQAKEPPAPKPIHSIKPLMPRKPKAPPPDAGLPWGVIGAVAGLLAALGAAVVVVVRRRRVRTGNVDIAPAPDAAVEPSLD